VNLGAVTQHLWVQYPELRKRVGREWTRLHYQNHKNERSRQFIKEKIKVLDRLMSEGGYGHLILAGDQRRIAEVRDLLPKRLESKLFDMVAISGKTEIEDVVATTLSAFIAEEERESGTMVERLLHAFYKEELAAFGPDLCLQALYRKQADVLVIAKESDPALARYCEACGWAASGDPLPDVCAECGAESLRECKAREELVRLAELHGCQIEFVGESHAHALDNFGGVGCLLRYAFPVTEGLTK
jgi:peptide subunit release factor 1 (eRF1)